MAISKETIDKLVMTKAAILNTSKPSTFFAELQAELNSPESQEKFRQMTIKYNQNYAFLSTQIVGSETRYK